jgi:hypothetical protein
MGGVDGKATYLVLHKHIINYTPFLLQVDHGVQNI